jgi:hypothetical protein
MMDHNPRKDCRSGGIESGFSTNGFLGRRENDE